MDYIPLIGTILATRKIKDEPNSDEMKNALVLNGFSGFNPMFALLASMKMAEASEKILQENKALNDKEDKKQGRNVSK
jgi:hypothetical protein